MAELSDFKNSPTLKAGAGRARLTAIYSPVAFKASVPDDFKNSKTKFNWAFGDGASGRGGSIKHAYEAPGNYQVVLNAENGEEEATARSTVKVFKPDLHLGYDLNGGSLMLTLVSRSAEELNIGGWQLSSMGKVFTFPQTRLSPVRRSWPCRRELLVLRPHRTVRFLIIRTVKWRLKFY